jgi:hypothetical protein
MGVGELFAAVAERPPVANSSRRADNVIAASPFAVPARRDSIERPGVAPRRKQAVTRQPAVVKGPPSSGALIIVSACLVPRHLACHGGPTDIQ